MFLILIRKDLIFLYDIKDCENISQKLTVCIENEEKEDVIIIYADPSEKVIKVQSVFFSNKSAIINLNDNL